MTDARFEAVRRTVRSPHLTAEELANQRGDIKLSADEIRRTLNELKLSSPDDRPMPLANWAREGLVVVELTRPGKDLGPGWFDYVAELLARTGLPRESSRLWLLAFLKQFIIRMEPLEGVEFYHDLNLLRQAAQMESFGIPDLLQPSVERMGMTPIRDSSYNRAQPHGKDVERVIRFLCWATVRLLTSLSPDVTKDWLADGSDVDIAKRTCVAWVIFALSQAYPSIGDKSSSELWKQTEFAVEDGGFLSNDVCRLYQQWWRSSGGGIPNSVGLQPVRDVLPKLKLLADNFLKSERAEWEEAWQRLAAISPDVEVSKNTSFRDRRGYVPLLEVQTGLRDALRFRRPFAWQVMTVFEETLVSLVEPASTSVVIQAVCQRWTLTPPLADGTVEAFLREHKCEDPQRIRLLAGYLRSVDGVGEDLNQFDRMWLVERTLLIVLREAMALGIPLSRDFYQSLGPKVLASLAAKGARFLPTADNSDLDRALRTALKRMGIDRQRESPHGASDWRNWVSHRDEVVKVPLRGLVREALEYLNTPMTVGGDPNAIALHPPVTPSRLDVSGDRVFDLLPIHQALDNIQESVVRTRVGLNKLGGWMQETQDQLDTLNEQMARAHRSEGTEQRIEDLRVAVRAWQTQVHDLEKELQSARQKAITDFIREWNGGESRNSVFNRLYGWARDSKSLELAAAAKDILARMDAVGIRPRKTEYVGQPIDLDNQALDDWNIPSGVHLRDYHGSALVVTPQWWYQDIMIQRGWIGPPS